ncbi:MAG: hypothetical protein ACOC7T_01270 [Planctomycetota bacterium]
MPGGTQDIETSLREVRDYYRKTAEEVRREQEALQSLHHLLVDLSEQSLRLHRRSNEVLGALQSDLRKVKSQLRRLSVSRR